MKTIAERLKSCRESKGWSQAQLAVAAGVSTGTIGNIESGTRQSKGSLPQIAEALGCSGKWLATGIGEMHPPALPQEINLENNPDYPAIRRVRFKLSAGASGFGVDYSDDDAAPIVFQRVWYERRTLKPEKLFAIKVRNSSMEPGLYDSDTVVVNTASTTPRDGIVFAVNYEGELVIKRLLRDAGAWWLCSDNPDQHKYPRKRMSDECFIIGEIVHKQSERI